MVDVLSKFGSKRICVCVNCKSVLRYHLEDVLSSFSLDNTQELVIICPVCNIRTGINNKST